MPQPARQATQRRFSQAPTTTTRRLKTRRQWPAECPQCVHSRYRDRRDALCAVQAAVSILRSATQKSVWHISGCLALTCNLRHVHHGTFFFLENHLAARTFKPSETVDFVVVGSGAAGGVIARELAVAGFG